MREGVVRLAVCRANVQRHVLHLWHRGVGGTGVDGHPKKVVQREPVRQRNVGEVGRSYRAGQQAVCIVGEL